MHPRPRTHRFSSRLAAILATGLGVLLATPAGAPIVPRSVLKSFFAESPGKTVQARATDTEILLTYAAGLAELPSGSGASTALHLYDAGGEPLLSSTGEIVCAPCV